MNRRFVYVVRAPDGAPQGDGQQEFIDQILDSNPAEPSEPAQPGQPAEPSVPAEPQEPQVPSEPQVPVQPQQPAQPQVAQPAQPQEPAQPSTEELLRAEIQRLTALMAGGQPQQGVHQIYPPTQAQPAQQAQVQEPGQQPAQTQQPAPVQTPAQQAQANFEFKPSNQYLNEDELDRVIDNPKLLLTAIERAQKDVVEQLVPYLTGQLSQNSQTLPQLVQQTVAQQVAVSRAITDFYDANQDLRPYAQFTQLVMSELEQKNLGQNKTYAELFADTANETRKRLGLPNPTVQSTEPQSRRGSTDKPAFAGGKGGTRQQANKQNDFYTENADLLHV